MNTRKSSINVYFLDLSPSVPRTIHCLQKWIFFHPPMKEWRGIFRVASNKNSSCKALDNRLSIIVSVGPKWVCIVT